MSKWIKKDDRVLVIAGNNKGMTGKVLVRKDDKVIVEGINIRKKHLKGKNNERSSGIIEREMAIHISNVHLCDLEGKPIKVKVRETADGKKELFYLAGDKEMIHRQLRKGS